MPFTLSFSILQKQHSIVTHPIFTLSIGARFHDFHHYNFNGNYSSTFRWWDWIFSTDRQWKEFQAKQQKQKTG
jgi:methylsterol monooxygenase